MKKECYGITIDLSRDDNLTDFAKNLLKDYYMHEDEVSPQESFARAAVAFSSTSTSTERPQRVHNASIPPLSPILVWLPRWPKAIFPSAAEIPP